MYISCESQSSFIRDYLQCNFLKHFLMVYFSAVLPMVVPIFNCQYDFLINLFATTFLRMNAENEGIKRGNVQKVFISSRLRHL